MANVINANGITIKTLAEIKLELTNGMKAIYGDDINVASDSPDGQLIALFSQSIVDVENLMVSVYNSFDPDLAIGVTLDERVAINGIQRLGGTYSKVDVTVTFDRASVFLQGLDADISNPDGVGFTVSDTLGNNWILSTSYTSTIAGPVTLEFRAQNNGAVETTAHAIQTQVTIILGVTGIDNVSKQKYTGINQETDSALKLRRQQSVSLASQGYLASLQAELLNISGVTYAKIYENWTDATVLNIPSHSIWVVVDCPSAVYPSVAYAIYTKRNAGCGMVGSLHQHIAQIDGSDFVIYFDIVATQILWIKFKATAINPDYPIDEDYIRAQILARLSLDVNQSINVNEVASLIAEIDSNCLATDMGVSLDGTNWLNIVSPTNRNERFVPVADASHIIIT
jgi:uncharacterized phage protein gp47/JayE